MRFATTLFVTASYKTLIVFSIFALRYFNVSIILSYFVSASFGLLVCIFWSYKKALVPTKSKFFWAVNGTRCFLRDCGLLGFFYCFVYGSIPRVSAIFFTTSFLLPLFGSIFFKTPISVKQWLFLLLGYVGLLLVLHPLMYASGHWHNTIDIIALISACALAGSNTVLKYLTQKKINIIDSLFIGNVVRFAMSIVCMMIFHGSMQENFQAFSGNYGHLAIVLLACACAQNAAQAMHVYAFRWGQLPFLGIMDLWRFVCEVAGGYIFFLQVLDTEAFYGVACICTAIVGMLCFEQQGMKTQKGINE